MPTRPLLVPVFSLLLAAAALPGVRPADAAAPKSIGTVTVVGEDGLAGLSIVAFQGGAHTTVGTGGSGGAATKVVFDTFTVTKLVDAASPRLLDLTFRGRTVTEVRIDMPLKRGGVVTYVLTDVLVVANERHTPIGGPPLQDVGFTAKQVREIVTNGEGSITTCLNVVTQEICPTN